MKKVHLDKDIVNFLRSRQSAPGESINAILRREIAVPQELVDVELDDQTYAFLASLSVTVGESASDILRRRLQVAPTPAPPSPQPQLIDFFIPADRAIWNTAETAVLAQVGDTLLMHNDDVVTHVMQTAGAPFENLSNPIPAKSRKALLLVAPYDAFVSGPINNQGAGFWMVVT